MQKYFIGTSGWQYPEWLGKFYPDKMRKEDMLRYYAERFNSVEVNYTFSRLPRESVLKNWTEQTPKDFRFTLKAHRAITHSKNLAPGDILEKFLSIGKVLGQQRGLILFQYPDWLQANIPSFAEFLKRIPKNTRAAFEFRHPSWFCDEVYALLKKKNLALCAAESESLKTPPVKTADYGYFRLRLTDYTDKDIAAYARLIRLEELKETYVYFKHEEAGVGPVFAKMLSEKLKSRPS
jgi:uncharacterized protein YecE (DUF72 family)